MNSSIETNFEKINSFGRLDYERISSSNDYDISISTIFTKSNSYEIRTFFYNSLLREIFPLVIMLASLGWSESPVKNWFISQWYFDLFQIFNNRGNPFAEKSLVFIFGNAMALTDFAYEEYELIGLSNESVAKFFFGLLLLRFSYGVVMLSHHTHLN